MPAIPTPTPTPTPEPTPTPTPEPCLRILGADTISAGLTYEFSVVSRDHDVNACTAEIIGDGSLDITWVTQDPKQWDGEIQTLPAHRGETIQLDADDTGGCRAIKAIDVD